MEKKELDRLVRLLEDYTNELDDLDPAAGDFEYVLEHIKVTQDYAEAKERAEHAHSS